jgi:ubiquinone biosynthesis protein UbiJ
MQAKGSLGMLAPLANTLLGLAEIGGNRLLSLDQQVVDRCSELQGYCIEIQITDLDINIFCHPGSWGMRLSLDEPAKPVDATISGRLMALLSLAMQEDKISTSIQEGVSINGNATVGQQAQKLITELDIDWEEVLSHYTGDILAYRIHQQARGAGDWLRQSVISLSQTTSEYLREESRMSPTQVEFERFQQQATMLKQGVERAEVRLRHLMPAVSGSTKK